MTLRQGAILRAKRAPVNERVRLAFIELITLIRSDLFATFVVPYLPKTEQKAVLPAYKDFT